MCPVHQGASRYQLTLISGCGATQCYVIAAAQKGRHNEKRESYGHALVIDPWGVVVAQCSQVCASMPLVGGAWPAATSSPLCVPLGERTVHRACGGGHGVPVLGARAHARSFPRPPFSVRLRGDARA